MNEKRSTIALLPVLLWFILSACQTQTAIPPSATPHPTATQTPSPTFTPTNTTMPTPTDTEIPVPASLSGLISLSRQGENEPFVTSLELREADGFDLIDGTATDASGAYRFEDIFPGTYGLWILITTETEMLSGCRDVAPPDSHWRMGIIFEGDMAMTMENAYLSKALMLVENIDSADLQAESFFAVFNEVEIHSADEATFDVTLICK